MTGASNTSPDSVLPPRVDPGSWAAQNFWGPLSSWSLLGLPVNYYYVVDVFLAYADHAVRIHFWGNEIERIETPDVAALLHRVRERGGSIDGPLTDSARGFSFGSFKDPEGNPWWVVDPNCP